MAMSLQTPSMTGAAGDCCVEGRRRVTHRAELGKRIVEVAPGRRTEIDRPLPTEIIRDWALDDICRTSNPQHVRIFEWRLEVADEPGVVRFRLTAETFDQ